MPPYLISILLLLLPHRIAGADDDAGPHRFIRTVAAVEGTKLEGNDQAGCAVDPAACRSGYLSMWSWMKHLELGTTGIIKIVAADEISDLITYYPGRWMINRLAWTRMGVDIGVMSTSNILTSHYKMEAIEFLSDCAKGDPSTPVASGNIDESIFFFLEGYAKRFKTVTVDGVTIGYIPLWGDGHYISTLGFETVMPTLTRRLREEEKADLIYVICLGYDILFSNATSLADYDVDLVFLPAASPITEPQVIDGTTFLPRLYTSIRDRLDHLHYIDAVQHVANGAWQFAAHKAPLNTFPLAPGFQEEHTWWQGELSKASTNNKTLTISTAPMVEPEDACAERECLLGNLFTDACKAGFEDKSIDLMVFNGGAFLSENGWPAGEVTKSDIQGVFPYPNTLCSFRTTGSGLFHMIEHGLTAGTRYEDDSGVTGVTWGGFLQMSGVRIEYNMELPVGKRVVQIYLQNEGGEEVPITRKARYTVGSIQYVCEGGDQYDQAGFEMEQLSFMPQEVSSLVADYLTKMGEYDQVASGHQPVQRLFPVADTTSLNLVSLTQDNCTDQQRWDSTWFDCEPCPEGTWHPEPGSDACLDKATSTSVSLGIVLGVSLSGLLVMSLIGYYFLTKKQRRIQKLNDAHKLAEDCALAIASMRLEELDYLEEFENPSVLQNSFRDIAKMLKEYRNFLPLSLLRSGEPPFDQRSLQVEAPPTPCTDDSGDEPTSKGMFSEPPVVAPVVLPHLQQTGLKKKPVTVMSINVVGFRHLLDPRAAEPVAVVHAGYIRHVLASISGRGVAEPFSGDRLTITWNTSTTSPPHKDCACDTGIELLKDRPHGLELQIGLSSSYALCGNLGTEGMKRFSVLGTCFGCSVVLQMLNKQYKTRLLVDSKVELGLGNKFYFLMQDRLYFRKYDLSLEVWELLGHKKTDTTEWMYQVAQGDSVDPNTHLNQAWRQFFLGSLGAVRSKLSQCKDRNSPSYNRLTNLVQKGVDGQHYYGADPGLLESC